MNEGGVLMGENRKERPRDSNGSREITFGTGEGVCRGSSFQEEQCEEDKSLGPDTREARGFQSIGTESFEYGEYDDDSRPAVVKGKRKVDKDFIPATRRRMIFLDDVVDVGYGGTDQERKEECGNIMLLNPEVHKSCIEDSQKGKTPVNSVNDDLFPFWGKLVDDGTQEEKVYQSPDKECPGRRGDIGLFDSVVNLVRVDDGANV